MVRFTFIIMSEQQFPLTQEERGIHQLTDVWSEPLSPNAIKFEDFIDDHESLTTLNDARNYCHHLGAVGKNHSRNMSGMNSLHSRCGWHLRRLLQKAPPGSRPPLTECCRYATAIFIFFGFVNHFPDPTLLINTILHKLKDSLSDVLPCSPAENVLVLWLLMIGGAASWKLPAERAWFLSFMIDTATELELNSWDKVKDSMRRVMWIEGMNESPFMQLWEDAKHIANTETTQVPFSSLIYHFS